jgi:tubulin polyglutamylase TTLL6/13
MDWDILWTDSAVSIDFLTRMQNHQKINHFPGMSNLSRKGLLTKNLKRMQKAFPDSYAYFPLTFILPQDIISLNKFQDRMRLKGERATFIIKPEVGCQGRGIYLWQDSIGI